MNQIKPASPIKIVNEKELKQKNKAAQRIHTDFVHNVIDKFHLYTSAKTIPASVLSEHKNQVDTFSRTFIKVPDFQKKQTTGYSSEDDKSTNLIKFGNQKV